MTKEACGIDVAVTTSGTDDAITELRNVATEAGGIGDSSPFVVVLVDAQAPIAEIRSAGAYVVATCDGSAP